uniref:Uncharacterized protein n=1 Tax=Megaselia scalaris TaxID=36166 RepID=T1GI78_MEGSC
MWEDMEIQCSSTLPRPTTAKPTDGDGQQKVTNATSSTSLYDNVASGTQTGTDAMGRQKSAETNTLSNHIGSQIGQAEMTPGGTIIQRDTETCLKSEGTQAGGTLQLQQHHYHRQRNLPELSLELGIIALMTRYLYKKIIIALIEFNIYAESLKINSGSEIVSRDAHHNMINNNMRRKTKSIENMNSSDTSTMKRMLKPMPSIETQLLLQKWDGVVTHFKQQPIGMHQHIINNNNTQRPTSQVSRFSASRSSHEIGRGQLNYSQQQQMQQPRNMYLDIEGSPPSDNVMFDNNCYATTPSSSNGNSDQDQSYGQRQNMVHMVHQRHHQQQQQSHQQGRGMQQHQQAQPQAPMNNQQGGMNQPNQPGSPTSRLLLEYEMHLRNTLAKGTLDSEPYSLQTFENLLSQSIENLELEENIPPPSNQRSPYPFRRRPTPSNKSSTLPLPPHRPLTACADKERDRERDGYYSDRNELVRERERERERDRGYLSDHNSSFSNSRCTSCIGESARAQWFRHSDGWRSGSTTLGSGSGQGLLPSQASVSTVGTISSQGGHKRSPWDSLPSLCKDNSLNDSGYKSARADSLEHSARRAEFIRQDSLRSEYLSDRESRYGMMQQQASIESTDSRQCYLTSSEV